MHQEQAPWDAHAVAYAVMGIMELEVRRVADWLVDLPWPGRPLRPFERSTDAIRAAYGRLPPWTVRQRLGELVDALQLPELSLGDASAVYSASAGGMTGPGSGTVLRVLRLVDWPQHAIGDVNRLLGRPVSRSRGLITWRLPGHLIDDVQQGVLRTFTDANALLARLVDASLNGFEGGLEVALNVAHATPHRDTTVFLRLPIGVFRTHELWFVEHGRECVIGPASLFVASTHADLAHSRRRAVPIDAAARDQVLATDVPVIVMLSERMLARAPAALRAYAVPAAWVVDADATNLAAPGSR